MVSSHLELVQKYYTHHNNILRHPTTYVQTKEKGDCVVLENDLPEIIGHIFLPESTVGRKCQIDLS